MTLRQPTLAPFLAALRRLMYYSIAGPPLPPGPQCLGALGGGGGMLSLPPPAPPGALRLMPSIASTCAEGRRWHPLSTPSPPSSGPLRRHAPLDLAPTSPLAPPPHPPWRCPAAASAHPAGRPAAAPARATHPRAAAPRGPPWRSLQGGRAGRGDARHVPLSVALVHVRPTSKISVPPSSSTPAPPHSHPPEAASRDCPGRTVPLSTT